MWGKFHIKKVPANKSWRSGKQRMRLTEVECRVEKPAGSQFKRSRLACSPTHCRPVELLELGLKGDAIDAEEVEDGA
eukprot:767376-Hanusia_phi.AAC.5